MTRVALGLALIAFLSAGSVTWAASQKDAAPLVEAIEEKWSGDLDSMVERRVIRALVVYSKTFYFVDRGTQRGASYEALKAFETELNRKLKTGTLRVEVVFIPVSRAELLPRLVEGRGDLAVANLTVTPERLRLVDFSDPVYSDVSEIVVTGREVPPLRAAEELAGREVFVRRSSSYYASLRALDERLARSGKPRLVLRLVDEALEDEDLLEMVHAGLIPAVVVDDHKAQLWAQVFDGLRLHPEAAVRTGSQIAWALRKNSPKLRAALNEFVADHRAKTQFGNIMIQRYLKSTRWVKNAAAEAEYRKFQSMIDLFQKYGDQYRFDWLMVAAQGYQESGLDQSLRSQRGAVGVMQLLPATAAGKPIEIRNVEQLENNIHAGVKYLRFLVDRYFADPAIEPVDRWLLAFAAYNAGPARIARLRESARRRGLDPNRWFDHVEHEVARDIGRETVQYVSNIFKYYVAYRLALETRTAREKARQPLN